MERIGARGPITFAEFMEAALYDPADGFYARPPIGENGHFVTSPHVSPAFGDLLARQVAECWDLLDRPRRMTVLEPGAGDGTLAGRLLEAVRAVPDLAAALRYIAIERTPGARAALQARGLEAVASLREVEPFTGVVVANEVLDNLPFHRLRRRRGRVVEIRVGADHGLLMDVEGPPSPEALSALEAAPTEGEERRVSPAGISLMRDVARALTRGYAFLFDYAVEGDGEAPVHAYRHHRVLADVLEDPGSRDVTAGVDLEAVARAARSEGLQAWGPVPQREALLALGYRTWAAGVRKRQTDAEAAGDHRRALRLYEARSRASILVDPDKLGSLRLLALGTDGLPPPASVVRDRDAGC